MIEDKERWNLLASISNLYYNTDMTQNEIADVFYVSRSKVSRLIKEARQLGIVEIHIHEPWDRESSIEYRIQEKFGIERAMVLKAIDSEEYVSTAKLGQVAAYYLDMKLKKKTVLGISWGNTIYHIVNSIQEKKNTPVTVVPIMGAANMNFPQYDILELSKKLAGAFGGEYKYIVAPLIVENKNIRDSLIKGNDVKEAIDLATNADVILTSVGSVTHSSWKEYLQPHLIQELLEAGAIGHIGGRFYDKDGKQVVHELSNRTISIDLETIEAVEDVICVAGRAEKAEAILGALKGNFINTLITDEHTANQVLSM